MGPNPETSKIRQATAYNGRLIFGVKAVTDYVAFCRD
jgi:hypothetical protein